MRQRLLLGSAGGSWLFKIRKLLACYYFILFFLREKAELIYSSMQEPSITRVVLRIWALSTYTSHLVGEMEEEEKDFYRKNKQVSLGKTNGF